MEKDLDRILKIVDDGLRFVAERTDEAGHTNLRLDSFAFVGIVAYDDEDGDEREEAVVLSESKRIYVKEGILHAGIDQLKTWRDD